MEFDQLRTMLAVLEHGSFTRAADALGLSQSTVSFHIKGLEAALGTRVLDRGRDGVQPTPQGKILRRYAERLVALRTEAVQRLEAEADGRVGEIIVAASTIPAEYLLPPMLRALRRTHPGVSVTVHVSDSGGALATLAAGGCDLALVGRPPTDRRIEARPFADDEVVLVGPGGDDAPFGDATASSLGSLGSLPLVLRQESSGTRAAVADLLAKIADGSEGARTVVGSTEATKRCVLAGLGLAFVSRVAVADELADGRMQVLPLEGTPVPRTFYVAQLRNATLSSAASMLVDLLRAGT